MPTFSAQELKAFASKYFMHWGVSEADAASAADVLVSADMRGVDSHGLIRLQSYYGSRLDQGLINPRAALTLLRESSTTLTFDANNGLGHPAGVKAMHRCIEKARESGVALATVRNSNHYGIAGYYAMMALEEGMIGVSFTNSAPLVAPTHGKAAMLGTNPIAMAVPAKNNRPYVLDMATSIVPIGRVSVYQKNGQSIPAGWGIDEDGKVTEDPQKVLEGGALMPLGGTDLLRGYKGYGLALLVDIFSGVLSGSGFSDQVSSAANPGMARIGHFFAAIRIDAFRDFAEFTTDMDLLLDTLRNSAKAAGEERIYIHGEKEFEKAERAATNGVPLSDVTVQSLINAAEHAGIPFTPKPM